MVEGSESSVLIPAQIVEFQCSSIIIAEEESREMWREMTDFIT